ncbi:MAG: hypothetical protein M0P01_13335, partial [Treponema sp.]|nr:hypothetical protein [Treponema sp.]
ITLVTTAVDTLLESGTMTISDMGLYTLGTIRTETAAGTQNGDVWSVSCSGVTPGTYSLIVTGTLSETAWSAEKTITITYAETE